MLPDFVPVLLWNTGPQGTSNYNLSYSRKDNNGTLIGYSDADWAGDMNDWNSISGYLFMVSGAAVSWKSRNKRVLLSLWQKPNMLHWLVPSKKLPG
jgi:hypothetical protein